MSCRCNAITNRAYLDFYVAGTKYVVESNEVKAKKLCLKVIKQQSREVVLTGDKICYTITVINDSNVDVCDLEFRDRLIEGVHYERNTFRYNGEYKCPTLSGHSINYHIDKLNAHCECVITFEVEVE